MSINIISPCSNCGGTNFTNPTKAGMPLVKEDESNKIEIQVGNVVLVDVTACNNCKQLKIFYAN